MSVVQGRASIFNALRKSATANAAAKNGEHQGGPGGTRCGSTQVPIAAYRGLGTLGVPGEGAPSPAAHVNQQGTSQPSNLQPYLPVLSFLVANRRQHFSSTSRALSSTRQILLAKAVALKTSHCSPSTLLPVYTAERDDLPGANEYSCAPLLAYPSRRDDHTALGGKGELFSAGRRQNLTADERCDCDRPCDQPCTRASVYRSRAITIASCLFNFSFLDTLRQGLQCHRVEERRARSENGAGSRVRSRE